MTVVVNYGGGVNSTALLVGMAERGERPDLVIWADTGGEMPETYAYLPRMAEWLARVDFPELVRVGRRTERHESLEAECINNETLPGLAFGFRGCSDKWKRRPVDQYVRQWQPALDAWEAGELVTRYLGIDAGETHRGQNLPSGDKFDWRFPLIEWGWGREECLEAIARAGLPAPIKSACFFCPAMKKREVIDLSKRHPRLFERAVAMEQNAAPKLGVVRGLGRHWSWEELVAADTAQLKFWPDTPDEPCMCFDGGDE